MPFTFKKKVLLKFLGKKRDGALNEFVSSINNLLRKIDKTGSVERKVGSGRPVYSNATEYLMCKWPHMQSRGQSWYQQKSSRNPESYQHIVQPERCIAKHDLQLNVFRHKKAQLLSDVDHQKRITCCRTLLRRRRLLNVDNIWLLDEKIFTVQPPINTQYNCVYAAASKKSSVARRRLIKDRKHFSESVMASVAVSKASKTSVHFIDKGTKVDASYYRETLLQRCLLPDIRQKSDDHLVFQQDGVPSHRVKSTVEFLQRTVPNFIEPSVWPPISSYLNPVDYAVWGALHVSHSNFQSGWS